MNNERKTLRTARDFAERQMKKAEREIKAFARKGYDLEANDARRDYQTALRHFNACQTQLNRLVGC